MLLLYLSYDLTIQPTPSASVPYRGMLMYSVQGHVIAWFTTVMFVNPAPVPFVVVLAINKKSVDYGGALAPETRPAVGLVPVRVAETVVSAVEV